MLTDKEYAIKIYCVVFRTLTDEGDADIEGIFEAISSLREREQFALESYYRNGLTYKKTGEIMGVSLQRVRAIVINARLKLRREPKLTMMSKSRQQK